LLACGDDGTSNGGGAEDGGNGGDSNGTEDSVEDVFVPPTGDDVLISYVTHTRGVTPGDPQEWRLWITDNDCEPQDRDNPCSLHDNECELDNCQVTEVTGGEFSCQRDCMITPEMDYILWVDPSRNELKIAEIGTAYEISNNTRIVTTNVDLWEVGPERVVYSRAGRLYSQLLAGGDETDLGSLISADGRALPGGFYYAPHIQRVFTNVPTSLSAMNLTEVSVTNGSDSRLLYHFVSDNEQITGSFYQNRIDMSLSPDGQFLVVLTEHYDSTDPCNPGSPERTCQEEYVCSSDSQRCRGEQLVMHVINRSESQLLSTPGNSNRCADSGACGERHLCDLTDPDTAGLGVCVPGKRIIGPYGRFACDEVAGGGPYLDPGEYLDVVESPQWRSDNSIILVGINTCPATDIDVTDVVAYDLDLNSMELIIENPRQSHGGPDCYNEVEDDFDPRACIIEIKRFRMSPSGNTMVFVGSSTGSRTDSELWQIDAYGRGGKTDMTRDILTEILAIGVYDQ
jgi:hypothetical protein